ncbi:hypothetical protein [Amycolatopsis albispora]|uniref:hypothetical protein n=1 Tax=Amycolatopsis albispora TaxID=1804986 RepID=UPI0013B3A2B7|nr:hypothetical protein [Amycolatopsis albispora]
MTGIPHQLISAIDKFAGNAILWIFLITVALLVHYFERLTKGLVRLSRERRIRVAQKAAMDMGSSASARKAAREMLERLLSESRPLDRAYERGDEGEEWKGPSDPSAP